MARSVRWTPLLTSTTTRLATLSASWMAFRLHSSWQLRGRRPCRWRSLPKAWTIRSSCWRVRCERVTQGTAPCGLSSRGAMTSSIGVTERPWRHCPCSWAPSTATRAVVGVDTPRAVDRLLARSLLARDRDLAGLARYRLLDPVCQFAHEQATTTIRKRARDRHLEHHVELAARLDDRIRTVEATASAAVARACADDLRAAATYSLAERSASAGRLVTDLYWPWFLDGTYRLRSWTTSALSFETDPRVHARLLRVLASSALAQGDTAVAVDAARHQLDLAQTIHDEELVALAHNLLGMAAWAQATAPPPTCSTGPPASTQASGQAMDPRPHHGTGWTVSARGRRQRGRPGHAQRRRALG